MVTEQEEYQFMDLVLKMKTLSLNINLSAYQWPMLVLEQTEASSSSPLLTQAGLMDGT
jgi:hypothetical protein